MYASHTRSYLSYNDEDSLQTIQIITLFDDRFYYTKIV
jgi:hypothetical protein